MDKKLTAERGERFHAWTVLGPAKMKPFWVCQCDCGTIREMRTPWRMNGPKSCGCKRKNWRKMTQQEREDSAAYRAGVRVHFHRGDQMACGLALHQAPQFSMDAALVTCKNCIAKVRREK